MVAEAKELNKITVSNVSEGQYLRTEAVVTTNYFTARLQLFYGDYLY
jgi:hypothetical protein